MNYDCKLHQITSETLVITLLILTSDFIIKHTPCGHKRALSTVEIAELCYCEISRLPETKQTVTKEKQNIF